MGAKETAAKYQDYLIEQRRWFHRHPEYSEEEFESCKHIRAELDKMGVEWRACGLETGTLATIRGAKPGKTILLRADMDALKVQEETGLPYASENAGLMHACGHDCHMAMMLAAAKMLNERKDELCGTVRLAFQPAEEVATGARSMIEQGALDGVDGCFAMHVWADVESGKVAIEAGPKMAAADWFLIDIAGKGSHGAAPHQGIDAAPATAAMVEAIQTIVSREVDPNQPAVMTVGVIDVGTRWNVVPEYSHIEGTARCFDPAVRRQLEDGLRRIVKSVAEAYRVEAKLEWRYIVPPVVNTPEISALAAEAAKKVIGPDALAAYDKTNGGEDFAYFMEKVPGAVAFLGIRSEACGAVWVNHSGHFCVDEDALVGGAKLYVQTAMDHNAQ